MARARAPSSISASDVSTEQKSGILPRTSSSFDALNGPRADLARAIPRRPRVVWWMGLLFAFVFAVLLTPAINADRMFVAFGGGRVADGQAAKVTVRVPPFAG